MNEIPKSCTTCQHREGRGEFSRCTATGYYAQVARAHPICGCDKNFSLWEKRFSAKERFLFWLKGEIS